MVLKKSLHPKNKHRHGYNLKLLAKVLPELSSYIITNKFSQQPTIDFSDAEAVKVLNFALLKQCYQIHYWDFPKGYLCPPIPGRVDYIHYLADLLYSSDIKTSDKVSVLDIGTGASCIYPILGTREYGWHFVATDIDPVSIKVAKTNVLGNKNIAKKIQCRQQKNSANIFHGIIEKNEFYHLTLCNPPFHKSLADAMSGSSRKWQNLRKKSQSDRSSKWPQNNKKPPALNFGGQKAELWCPGGELAFIQQMISESRQYRTQVLWFTCLVSKHEHLSQIKHALKKANVSDFKIIKMAQGNKSSRFVAWHFH